MAKNNNMQNIYSKCICVAMMIVERWNCLNRTYDKNFIQFNVGRISVVSMTLQKSIGKQILMLACRLRGHVIELLLG